MPHGPPLSSLTPLLPLSLPTPGGILPFRHPCSSPACRGRGQALRQEERGQEAPEGRLGCRALRLGLLRRGPPCCDEVSAQAKPDSGPVPGCPPSLGESFWDPFGQTYLKRGRGNGPGEGHAGSWASAACLRRLACLFPLPFALRPVEEKKSYKQELGKLLKKCLDNAKDADS